jgi:hypothetical protein
MSYEYVRAWPWCTRGKHWTDPELGNSSDFYEFPWSTGNLVESRFVGKRGPKTPTNVAQAGFCDERTRASSASRLWAQHKKWHHIASATKSNELLQPTTGKLLQQSNVNILQTDLGSFTLNVKPTAFCGENGPRRVYARNSCSNETGAHVICVC